jgi:hypothetical protein
MNNKLNKKAQITIFIIVAVIIVISAISFFIIRSQLIESAKEDEVETAIWANSIKNYITDCITETSIKGFQELGWHGGFVDPKDPTMTGFNFKQDPNPTEADGVSLSQDGDPITYWFYLRAENLCSNCETGSLAPSKEYMQAQVSLFIERELKTCLNEFQIFKEEGFEFKETNEISATTTIAKDDIQVKVDVPLDIQRGQDKTQIKTLNTRIDLSLTDIYDIATSISIDQMVNQRFEDIFMFLLSDYSQVPNPNKIPPISWIDKKSGTVTWNLDDVEKRIKNYLISSNINLVQVGNTRNSQRIIGSNPIQQGVYNALYLDILDKEFPNQEVKFFYNPKWPIHFDISPKPLMPTSINTDFPFSQAPSTQTNYYEFFYDISFPIVVIITDNRSLRSHGEKGYTFMFALEANIRDNKNLLLWNQGLGTIGTWNNQVTSATFGGLIEQTVQCEQTKAEYQCPNNPINLFYNDNACDINCTTNCIETILEWECPINNVKYTNVQRCSENCKQEVTEVRNPQEIKTLFCNEEQKLSQDNKIIVKDNLTNQLIDNVKIAYGCGNYRQCSVGTTQAGIYQEGFPICYGDGYITLEKEGYVTKTFENIPMEYENPKTIELSIEPYQEKQVEVYHIPFSNLYRVKQLLENASSSGYHIAGNSEYENNTIVNETRDKLRSVFRNLTKILNPTQATREEVIPWTYETMHLLNKLSQEVNQNHAIRIGNYTTKIAKEMEDIQFIRDFEINNTANINLQKANAIAQKPTHQAIISLIVDNPPPLSTASIEGPITAPMNIAPGSNGIRITVLDKEGVNVTMGDEKQFLETYQAAGASLNNNTGKVIVTQQRMSASKIRFFVLQPEKPTNGEDISQIGLIEEYSKLYRQYIEPEFIQ